MLHEHKAEAGADGCCSLVPFFAAGPSPHEDFTLLQLRPARDRLLPGPQAPPREQGLRDGVPGAGGDLQPGPGPGPQLHRHHRALRRPRHLHRENTQLTRGHLRGTALGGTFRLGRDQARRYNPTVPAANVPRAGDGRGLRAPGTPACGTHAENFRIFFALNFQTNSSM